MHFLFNLLRIKGLYMFQVLLAHPQESLYKRRLASLPQVSKTTIHEAVTEKLGYRKLCASRVPKMLTDDHKMKRMGSELELLTRQAQEGDEFMDADVNGDETWIFHHIPESSMTTMRCKKS
jgi:hypothetical protein